jgi:hypothetical protein
MTNQNLLIRAPIMASNARRLGAVLLAVTISCAVATSASAQTAAPTAAQKETARSLMDVGDAKLAAGDVAAALHAYQAAHDIMGVPTTGVAVARAHTRLGNLVEAADELGRVRRHPKAAQEPEAFVAARREAQKLDADLVRRIPTVRVTITGPAADTPVELFIDGSRYDGKTAELPLRVNPGRRVIKAAAPGYLTTSEILDVAESETRAMELSLVPDPNAAQPSAPVAPTPKNDGAPPPPGGAPEGPTISPLTYSSFAVAGAGLLVGTITGIASLAGAAELQDQCPNNMCDPALEGNRDTTVALANVSNVSLAIGVAAAGVGIVSLIFDLDDSASDAASLAPLLGPDVFGLKGSF